jgi:hypothetical protein
VADSWILLSVPDWQAQYRFCWAIARPLKLGSISEVYMHLFERMGTNASRETKAADSCMVGDGGDEVGS